MTFLTALYTLIISPLELLFEVVFMVSNKIIGNEGLSIIFLSLAVQFLVLPLYKRADELQAEERDIQAVMAPHVKHIRKKFKGDERFFMLQEYYRINNYKPIYALKSSVSLLLQIPFFIAAYNLLSGMQSLQGMQFGIISDLGKEDAMFMIGSFPINILPIAMTLINILSGIIYTKGHPLKAKIQVYGLAAVFLVLLYHSPAGLVFYWLLNNVFSLVKNIFYKLKNPKNVLSIILAIAGAVILVLTLVRPDLDIRQKILLSIGCLLLALPLIAGKVKLKVKLPAIRKDALAFFAGAVLMALITGLLIPSAVIQVSVEEFIDARNPANPLIYIVNSVLVAFGSWVLWGGVFYFFMSDKLRKLFAGGIWIICGVSIMNYMLFGTDLGIMSSTLQFDIRPAFSLAEYLINTLVIIVAAAALIFVHLKSQKISKTILIAGILAVFGMGITKVFDINSQFNQFEDSAVSSFMDEKPVIPLSTDGNNVIVLMLDKAAGLQIPYIFNEKPELKEKFDGFTYYPNTISYGAYTNTGSPALFGGYDYTPEMINARDTEPLESKHNEALKVMPALFYSKGYTVTICDVPYAGYQWISDFSIYDEFPSFNCYIADGQFSYLDINGSEDEIRNRNFFCFSLMKISPLLLQETIYDDGLYNASRANNIILTDKSDSSSLVQVMHSLSTASGYLPLFDSAYSVLVNLPEMTTISDSDENTFLMMNNDTTHCPLLLQEPDYVPSFSVDNTAYDTDMVSRYTIDGRTMSMSNPQQISYYDVNMATYLMLGEWFDYLREAGVYDNTRIIIVSDHGADINQFNTLCGDCDMEHFIPVLLVKDFNSTGFTVSEEFMTNADTPAIAAAGIIDDPVNQYTGNPISSDPKDGTQMIFHSTEWNIMVNNGNVFLPGSWYSIDSTSDPHDPDSWKYIGDW